MNDIVSYIPSILSAFIWVGILVICIIGQSKTKKKGWGMLVGFAASRVILLFVQPFIFNYVYSSLSSSTQIGLYVNLVSFFIGLVPVTFLLLGLIQFYKGHMETTELHS